MSKGHSTPEIPMNYTQCYADPRAFARALSIAAVFALFASLCLPRTERTLAQ